MEQRTAPTQLYAASISIVSGLYALFATDMMGRQMLFMSVLGIVVLAHGAALLTPIRQRLGDRSGPLMAVYALLMLGNQVLVWRMGMAPDTGMIALAVLMLVSGGIMFRSVDMDAATAEPM